MQGTPLCTQRQKGLHPPSCQAAWARKLEGARWPCASSPTCPQLESGAGRRRTASTPRTAKGTSVGMPPPRTQSPQGTQHSLRAQPDCNSFPKGNAFSSPVQTGIDTQAVLAAPASAAVPARRRVMPARGERALPAATRLFTAQMPAWRGPWQLGTLGSCRGTACHPPATSTQEETP